MFPLRKSDFAFPVLSNVSLRPPRADFDTKPPCGYAGASGTMSTVAYSLQKRTQAQMRPKSGPHAASMWGAISE